MVQALSNIQIKENLALQKLDLVFDLDAQDVEIIDIWMHNKPVHRQFFIHDIIIYRHKGSLYIAKNEEVFEEINHCCTRNYKSFAHFVQSLFEEGEAHIPMNTFSFLDEPEQKPVTFYRSYFLGHWDLILNINDRTDVSEIQDPKIRELFVLYCKEKESIIQIEDQSYINIFNHHGRDIVNEVIASLLGFILGVNVPENFFGYKKFTYAAKQKEAQVKENLFSQKQGKERFVVSKALCDSLPCVSIKQEIERIINAQKTKDAGQEELHCFVDMNWQNANPFRIASQKSDLVYQNDLFIRDFMKLHFAHHEDLIRSHVLDQLLGGNRDRKIEEFIIPNGNAGPIYTVDFGEIFFAELQLPEHEPHYLMKKKNELQRIHKFLQKAKKEEAKFRQILADLLIIFSSISNDFVMKMIRKIPDLFFKYYWDESRLSYNPNTLLDYLLSVISFVRHFFSLGEERDILLTRHHIYNYYGLAD